MLAWHEIPQAAIAAFERNTGLAVCIHDLAGDLKPYLPPEYSVHYPDRCQRIKAIADRECVRCDAVAARQACAEHADGFLKICHAGFLEWVLPVFADGKLAWVIFAGQRRPGREIKCELVYRADKRFMTDEDLPTVTAAEAQCLLEIVRQLAARLREWRAANPADRRGSGETLPPEIMRKIAIRRFIQERCSRPIRLRDLAEHLHLSPSRTAHIVRETCGMAFCAILQEERLRHAAGLLRSTDLPVLEVALRSGFNDTSHFHRIFRRRFKLSPRQYRRQREAESPLARTVAKGSAMPK